MAALRYYAEAAESALLHFSPAETMSLTERALSLLPQTVHSDARTALEITLTALHGTAANQTFGFTSSDGKRAFERALVLLDDVPQHPLRGLVLSVLGLMLFLRGEVAAARTIARRSESLSLATGDRTALICACLVHGLVEHAARPAAYRARVAGERHRSQRGAGRCYGTGGVCRRPGRHHSRPAGPRVAAPRIRRPGACPHACCVCARPCVARAGAADGCAMARGDVRAAAGQCRAGRRPCGAIAALVEEYALPDGRAVHLWFRGWAEAQLGDPRAGYRLIREGHEEALRLDMRAYAGETLGYATEALIRAGDWLAARQQLDEAMEFANSTGERNCLTQLLLLDARIADALGETARGRAVGAAGHRRSARSGSAYGRSSSRRRRSASALMQATRMPSRWVCCSTGSPKVSIPRRSQERGPCSAEQCPRFVKGRSCVR